MDLYSSSVRERFALVERPLMNSSYPPRVDYDNDENSIRSSSVHPDPFEQFKLWYSEEEIEGVEEPHRISLATCTPDGIPSLRMVLLKIFGPEGFFFFTDYQSRKAQELSLNPKAAILSHWPRLQRQVRIEGSVKKASREVSEKYFDDRPRLSQAAASVSSQSSEMLDRDEFESRLKGLATGSSTLPCPENWGGYCLVPELFEFWQGQRGRVHDRVIYEKTPAGWILKELQP